MASILVVDDDLANRQLLTSLLGYGGHQTLDAPDGFEGLSLVRSQRPDLVILDIQMPQMDGYEFVRQLRSEPEISETPVMFYTATYDPVRAQTVGAGVGVRSVLGKPFAPETLFDLVDAALDDGSARPTP